MKLERCREENKGFSLLVLEADNLDRIRDSLGAEAVEPALIGMAQRLRALVDTSDTLACISGFQFIVASTGLGTEMERRVLEWMRVLSQPVQSQGRAFSLKISAGLCRGDGHADTSTLLRRAGLALTAARDGGGERLRWFEPGMQTRAVERLELEQLLRIGLSKREFRLVFQPQVNLASGEIPLMEALVRWQHPLRGPVSPAEFIPVAEASGQIIELGAWIMEQACRQASHLLRRLGRTPVVSVNVSPLQIQTPGLVQVVERCLAKHALDPSYLEIEVTEGVLLGDGEQAMQTLAALRAMGVKIAIDDFGTGFSSLSYLTRMHVDRLKIDRSFIVGMLHDDRCSAIVNAVIAMAHALGVHVTAEGVETQAQADHLQALGCDEIQGYWFSRPLAADALEHILAPL